jgi:hypothetical protein
MPTVYRVLPPRQVSGSCSIQSPWTSTEGVEADRFMAATHHHKSTIISRESHQLNAASAGRRKQAFTEMSVKQILQGVSTSSPNMLVLLQA